MTQPTSAQYRAGDRVWRWWDAGYKMDPQPLTVVRVNRLTLTVRTDQGSTFRLPHHHVEGLWTYDDPAPAPSSEFCPDTPDHRRNCRCDEP